MGVDVRRQYSGKKQSQRWDFDVLAEARAGGNIKQMFFDKAQQALALGHSGAKPLRATVAPDILRIRFARLCVVSSLRSNLKRRLLLSYQSQI